MSELLCKKKRNEMVYDKPTSAGYQSPNRVAHCGFPKEFWSLDERRSKLFSHALGPSAGMAVT